MNLDHYSYLIDRQHRFLLIGIVLLVVTAVFTLSGETLERYHGIVYRAKEPKRFWWDVVLYFIAGLFFLPEFKLRHYPRDGGVEDKGRPGVSVKPSESVVPMRRGNEPSAAAGDSFKSSGS